MFPCSAKLHVSVYGANRRLVWLLSVVVAAPAAFPTGSPEDGTGASPRALPQKESLAYSIEWRLITAGKAQLDWNAATHAGNPGWDASLRLESTGLVSKLFK